MNDRARINVRRMVMLRQPPERVWAALRDELPAVGRLVEGIDEIRLIERERDGAGVVRTVHEWRAGTVISDALRGRIDGDVLTWVERAAWDDHRRESTWSVESRILRGGLVGAGRTRVEPAMGGRGARLQLEVGTSIAPGALGPFGDGRLKTGMEEAAATLLARTLQELGAALEAFLTKGG